MSFKNLSKTFKYVNSFGESLVFEYDYGFLINKPVGIDAISISLSQAVSMNQIGSSIQSQSIQSRPININGILVGDFQSQNKEKMISVIRPDAKGRLYADDFYLEVYPTTTPTIEAKEKFSHFQFSVLAPYPFWRQDKTNQVNIRGLVYKFKLPTNFSLPYKFGENIALKFINVTNSGQFPIPFKVVFVATEDCANPTLTNILTQEFLKVEKEMIAGEKIEIDISPDKTSVISSIDGDIRGALTLDSNLFRLSVGDNALKAEAENTVDGLSASIVYSIEKVGISL